MFNYLHLTSDESQPEILPVLDPHVAMSLEKLMFTDEQIARYRSDRSPSPSTSEESYNITRDVDLLYLFSEEF